MAAEAAAKAEKAAAWAEWRKQHPLAVEVSEMMGNVLVIAIVCCGAWWLYCNANHRSFFPYSWTHQAVAADPPPPVPRPQVDVYLHRGFGP